MKSRHPVIGWKSFAVTVLGLLLILFVLPASLRAQTLRSGADPQNARLDELVKLYVSVLDKDNNFNSKLNYFDFEVTCDKVPQGISYFSKKDDPVGIVFLLDMSGSMQTGKVYQKLLPHLTRFIEQSHSQNEYSIISFNHHVGLNLPWTRDHKEVLKRLSEISTISPQGQTSLFDAIRSGIEQVSGRASARGAILLISDGVDSTSATKISEVEQALSQNKVPMYSILFNQSYSTLGTWVGPESADFEMTRFLSRLTSLTGGALFLPRTLNELEISVDHLTQELRHQYILGFKPSCHHQGNKTHQVRVKIADNSAFAANRKSTQIRHREEYK